MPKVRDREADTEAELRRKITNGSQDPDDYGKLAVHLFMLGSCDEAITRYQEAIDLSLTHLNKARVSTELGWLYYEMGQQDEALAMARSALELLSHESDTGEVFACRGAGQSLLAHCLQALNPDAVSEALRMVLEWLQRAIDDSEFTAKERAYLDAAIAHNLLGNSEKASALCNKCLQYELDDWERISCLTVQAAALRSDNRFREAEEAIEEAFRYASNYKTILPNLYIELGLIQCLTKRLPEARRTFQQALAALDSDPYKEQKQHLYGEAYRNLGAVCFDLGEYNEAMAGLKECLLYRARDDHNYWNALLWLGHCYAAMESNDDARACFNDVLASPHATEIDKSSAREVLGELFYKSGKYEKAAKMFQAALLHEPEDDPNHWTIVLWLGNCYEGIGAHDEARNCYEGILSSIHALESDKESAREGVLRLSPGPKKILH